MSSTLFKETLLLFLDNGSRHLVEHIPVVIEKLELLFAAVSSMPTFRFYASSLLLIYDGAEGSTAPIDIRMVDFANCISNADELFNDPTLCSYPPSRPGPDSGYMVGLRTLIKSFAGLYLELDANQRLADQKKREAVQPSKEQKINAA